jgi:biopolymer transport protein ExbB
MKLVVSSSNFMKAGFVIVVFLMSLLFDQPVLADSTKGFSQLQQAYQREYAFLLSQRRALAKQKLKQSQLLQEKMSKAQAEVQVLQNKALNVSQRAENLAEKLVEVQADVESLEVSRDLIANLLEQASFSLKGRLHWAESNSTEEKLQEVFSQARVGLNEAFRVKTKKGEFFLSNGNKVKGDVVQVGNVASFGISPEGSGSLYPVGEGRMKVYQGLAKDLIETFSAGRGQGLSRVFLYESTQKATAEKNEKSLMDVIEAGGAIGLVILALGIFAMALVVFRAKILSKVKLSRDSDSDELLSFLRQGDLTAAQKKTQNLRGEHRTVTEKALSVLGKGRESFEDSMGEFFIQQSIKLERYSTLVIVAASVAPLLGLLGTVTGMISTFDIITEFGTGDPKMLSGGISEALVTTKFGLIVAIPALLAGSMMNAWAKKIKGQFESWALLVYNSYELSLDVSQKNSEASR